MTSVFQVRFPDTIFRVPLDLPGLTREEAVDIVSTALRGYVDTHIECVSGEMPPWAAPAPGQQAPQRFRQLTLDDL